MSTSAGIEKWLSMDYRVELDIFRGPLDLLLYLVRKDELDIFDIPLARVTEQYLEYLRFLQMIDVDVAGDFLVMATTLMDSVVHQPLAHR